MHVRPTDGADPTARTPRTLQVPRVHLQGPCRCITPTPSFPRRLHRQACCSVDATPPTHIGTVASDSTTTSSAVPMVSRAFFQRVTSGPETKYYGYPTPADSSSRGRERAAGTWQHSRSRPRERPHLPPAEGLSLRPAWPTSSEEGPRTPCTPPASHTQRLWPQPGRCWGQAVGPETGYFCLTYILAWLHLDFF